MTAASDFGREFERLWTFQQTCYSVRKGAIGVVYARWRAAVLYLYLNLNAMLPRLIHQRQKLSDQVNQHASRDERFQILETHMKRHQYRPDTLIEVLHKAQNLFGYLDTDLLLFVAYRLKIPTSRAYGVATFYHFFTLRPPGKHTCAVCVGTACYVKGANHVLEAAQNFLSIKPGETTPDNQVSLRTARCLGACSLAPVVVYDGFVAPMQTGESIREKLKGWLSNGSQ
jgi:bidirectional [NiFe] hydrogenase diaphorase subunit